MKNLLIVLIVIFVAASSKISVSELSLEDVIDRMTSQERATYINYRNAYQHSSQALIQEMEKSRAYRTRIEKNYVAGQLTESQYEQGLRDYLKMLDAQMLLSKQDVKDEQNLARFVQRVRDRLMQEGIAASQAHREQQEQKRAAQQEPEEEIFYPVPPIPVGVAPYTPPVEQEAKDEIPPPPSDDDEDDVPQPPAEED